MTSVILRVDVTRALHIVACDVTTWAILKRTAAFYINLRFVLSPGVDSKYGTYGDRRQCLI